MITTIHDGSRAIIQYVLDKAIESDDILKCVVFNENRLTRILDFKSDHLFSACIQYLEAKKFVTTSKVEDDRHITLTIAAIDFLESLN